MAAILDWCDVFNDPRGGPGVILRSLAAGVVVSAPVADAPAGPPAPSAPPPAGPNDGQDGGREGPPEEGSDKADGEPADWQILPDDFIERAHKFLVDEFLGRDGRSAELIALGTMFYLYQRSSGCWIKLDPDGLKARVSRWAGGLFRRKVRFVKGEARYTHVPANLTTREVVDILERVRLELLIDLEGSRNDRGDIQPGRFWLRSTEHAADRYRGAPVPAAPAWERISTDPAAEGLPVATMLLPLADGLLDLDAWDRGELVRIDHTTRLFNLNRYPYTLPWGRLLEAAREAGAIADEVAGVGEARDARLHARTRLMELATRLGDLSRELAPRFWAFLAEALGREPAETSIDMGDEQWLAHADRCRKAYDENLRELAKFGGYVLGCDVKHHKGNVMVLHGPPGGGKGTLARVLIGVLGAKNVCPFGIEDLGKQEYLHACMGKALVYLSDERPSDLQTAREGANNMKKIAGGDAVSFRALFNAPVTNVQLFCRFLMLVNEMPHLADEALVRRMIVVDFARVAKVPDIGLDEALATPGERLGQLLWMLMGRLWLRLDGRFMQPASSSGPLEVYEAEADKYGAFVELCLEVTGDPAHRVAAAEIAEVYNAYAQAEFGHAKFPATPRVMAGVMPAMRRRWPESVHLVDKVHARVGEDRVWMYEGLRLRRTVESFKPKGQPMSGGDDGSPFM